tara:strand:+ start:443 stop:955 length:513 start_codon:yes stop_codon:yes gene_type:complete
MSRVKRNVKSNAESKVDTHKSTGGVGLNGFETVADRDTFVATYAATSVGTCLTDCITAFGTTRLQQFTGSSMTSLQKSNTGVDKINGNLFNSYIQSGSTVVHEGSVGNTVFRNGSVYWFQCSNPNEDDFEKFQNLLERRMAYEYINAASNSTETEKTNSLSDYTTYKASL